MKKILGTGARSGKKTPAMFQPSVPVPNSIPEMLEIVQFVCSGCGKRSRTVVVKEKMKCKHCGETYRREKGEWVWRMEDNPR